MTDTIEFVNALRLILIMSPIIVLVGVLLGVVIENKVESYKRKKGLDLKEQDKQ